MKALMKGEILIIKRCKRGMTIKEMSEDAKIPIQTISRAENKRKILISSALKFSDYYGVSFYDLFDMV